MTGVAALSPEDNEPLGEESAANTALHAFNEVPLHKAETLR